MRAGQQRADRARKPSPTLDGRIPGMQRHAFDAGDAIAAIYNPYSGEYAKLDQFTWYREEGARRVIWTVTSRPLPNAFHWFEAICDDYGNLVVPRMHGQAIEAWGLPS